MPCIAIIVEIAPGGVTERVRYSEFQKHARKIWGASVVELGALGFPGRRPEYGVKGIQSDFFRIIEQISSTPITRTALPDSDHLEAVNYDRSQLNKARLR